LECRAETSCQAPGGGKCSCELAHRQRRCSGEPLRSPPQSASSWVRPYLACNPGYAARRSNPPKK
jgi:hypothetical protein